MSICKSFCANSDRGSALRALNSVLTASAVALIVCASACFNAGYVFAQESSVAEKRFVVHAERLISLYDANEDGYLSQREISNMETPLKEERFDLDGDKRLSQREIVAAISRRSAPQKMEEQLARDEQAQEIARHVRAMLQRYDKNENGSIDRNELKGVPNQSFWTDFDNNKRITSTEMTRSLQEATKKIEDAVNGKRLSDEINEMYVRFLDAAMKKNDRNLDGKIDSKEIEQGRWSGPIRSYDKDKDGFLSRAEMLQRYEKMFKVKIVDRKKGADGQVTTASPNDVLPVAGLIAASKPSSGDLNQLLGFGGVIGSAKKIKAVKEVEPTNFDAKNAEKEKPLLTMFYLQHRKSSDVVRILNDVFDLPQKADGGKNAQAEQMKLMMRQMSGGGRKGDSPKGKTLKFGDDPAHNAMYVVAATDAQLDQINGLIELIDRKPADTKNEEKSKSKANEAIAVKLFLMRAPVNASEELIAEAVESIEESKPGQLSKVVAEAAKRLGIKKFDSVALKTVYLAKTNFNNTTYIGQANKDRRTSNNGRFPSQVGSNPLTLAFTGQIYATANEGFTKLQLDLEKTDFTPTGDDPEAKAIQFNFEFDSSITVYPGKPTVTKTSASDQKWILVTSVE